MRIKIIYENITFIISFNATFFLYSRALWSKMKFYVFLQKFFNEKFWKKYKFVQNFQNRIQKKLKKIKNVDENKWNKKDKTSLP